MTQDLRRPLDDAELDRLESLLDAFPEAMDIEMLDGFFTALVCSPKLVMPSEYMPHVLGGDGDGVFKDMAEVQEFYGLVGRHWNTVSALLHEEGACEPLFIEYDDGLHGNSWALGFLHGMALGGEAWEELLEDEAQGDMLIPILALAHEADPDPETRPEPIPEEDKVILFDAIAAIVPHLFEHFAPYRRGAGGGPGTGDTRRRGGPKIGRNAPCPCGSGRKYKGCCGKD